MRQNVVSVAALLITSLALPARAQVGRQLEFSVLGGTAHTDRTARLGAEQWIEPYTGVRLDARLATLWGGRVGMAVQLDRYRVRLDGKAPPPCMAQVCAAIALPPSSLVPVAIRSADERVVLGASWQRPLVSWLNADVMGLFGVRRVESVTTVDGAQFGLQFPSVQKGVFGLQAGLSAQWRGVIGGAAFEYAGGRQWDGVRRGQNRVALRAGYALPLGGAR